MLQKLKEESGYSLPSILLISVLIITLLFGLITILYFYNTRSLKDINKKKLDLACYSALQVILSDTTKLFINEQDILITSRRNNYIDEDSPPLIDSFNVNVKQNRKGLYYEIICSAGNNNDSSMVVYTLGDNPVHPFQNALILARPDLRAAVTGKTLINGDILATSDQFTRSPNYFGTEPANEKYLNGKIFVDDNINSKQFADTLLRNRFLNIPYSINDYVIEGDTVLDEGSLTKFINYENVRIYGNLNISGKLKKKTGQHYPHFSVRGWVEAADRSELTIDLELYTDSGFTVSPNVLLENTVITSAGPVEIMNSSLKNVQLLSRKGINITNSTGFYPTTAALYIDNNETSNLENRINLNSSVINGSVLLISSVTGNSSNKSRISMDAGSKVHGLLYSENNSEVLGDVTGSLFTYNLWYYKEPTEYINWLINLKVDRKSLDPWFLLPAGFSGRNNFGILSGEWIY